MGKIDTDLKIETYELDQSGDTIQDILDKFV